MMEQTLDLSKDRLHLVREAIKKRDSLTAIVLLKAHLAETPESAEAEELLGIAQAQAGNRPQALAALLRATEKDPRRTSAHYNRALLLDQEGELDEAIAEVQTALFIKPDYPAAQNLQQLLRGKMHDRAYRSDNNFAVVTKPLNPLAATEGEWAKLQCVSCHAMNFITARTCSRCGSYLPEANEVVPVE